MFLNRASRIIGRQCRLNNSSLNHIVRSSIRHAGTPKGFHSTRRLQVVKPVLLADIGEGIVECEIIQWFVEPEARVEEFSPLCEVQSDKASVEITSRFSGIVKKLYYDAGEMARVGKPFVDIDIQGDAKPEDLNALTAPEPASEGPSEPLNKEPLSKPPDGPSPRSTDSQAAASREPTTPQAQPPRSRYAALATPAVRHLSKELNVDITEIQGTGKDGRVLKEDIYRFVETKDSPPKQQPTTPPTGPSFVPRPAEATNKQVETTVELTNVQAQMFKTMTRSLSIPHFLYADEVDFTQLHELRRRLNKVLSQQQQQQLPQQTQDQQGVVTKLSYLPFVIKAVSMALHQYPILNARVVVPDDGGNGGNGGNGGGAKPRLVYRSQHNVGVAMDTPAGLVVPVVRDAGSRSVHSIAAELTRLQRAASAGRLSPNDLAGGTVTVSNIGSVGGTYVAPVLVEREVAILGLGRVRAVPRFGDDRRTVVEKQVCNLSWSADHRVVDGATMARAAEVVRRLLEEPDAMVLHLR
ncbi:hypothetical protein DL764_007790 [Monosporascus ibericus]|uniref:Dihydrolipoamide acetyltransferase component of pyruvate dehydrogenase complex n=1 Tax=Monosporascus ibericus TaxID=155417 RepID=A0A4Q4T2L7_9PEZI|nr:hypothetical protein DL764_007790 [Monosporascus ibericus]